MKSSVWKGNFGISQGYHSGHRAIDIKLPCGTSLYAPENTKALKSRRDQNGSEWLRLSVKGGFLDLVHLKKRVLKEGRKAKKGTLIGYSGKSGKATGCHTHIALWINGRFVEPTDWLLGDPCAKKEAWHKNRYEVLKKKYGSMKKKYIAKRDVVKGITKQLRAKTGEIIQLGGLLDTMEEKNVALKVQIRNLGRLNEKLIKSVRELQEYAALGETTRILLETLSSSIKGLIRRVLRKLDRRREKE